MIHHELFTYRAATSVFCIVALSTVTISCSNSLPIIPIVDGSSDVNIYADSILPNTLECEDRGRIHSEDGLIGGGTLKYQGTEERAIQKLRNEAAAFDSNTVFVTDVIVSLVNDPRHGHEIKIYAGAYNCPSTTKVSRFELYSIQ